ncbi:MAG: DUF2946 family protein [Serpentinimonas sp.]|nr:DUF2946 family protein [Serpentinimonas sp.]
MTLSARRVRLTAWLCMGLLVLAALFPVLAQAAVRLADAGNWVQVCTQTGMVWVRVDSHEAPDLDAEAAAPACDWCLAGHATPTLPPHGPYGLWALTPRFSAVAPGSPPCPPAQFHACGQPRAPPRLA